MPKPFVKPQAHSLKASFSPVKVPEAPREAANSNAKAVAVQTERYLSSHKASVLPHAPLPRPNIAHVMQPPESSNGDAASMGRGVPLPDVLSSEIVSNPVGDGVDANGLRQYRLGLAAAARRFKRYPPQAQENGWSGTAEVRIDIAANGVPQPPLLLRSSGHQHLDAAALDMIGNAAFHTIVPVSLRGQSFSVPLPVVFDLKGE